VTTPTTEASPTKTTRTGSRIPSSLALILLGVVVAVFAGLLFTPWASGGNSTEASSPSRAADRLASPDTVPMHRVSAQFRVMHRHGRSPFLTSMLHAVLGEPTRVPDGFCIGVVTLTESGLGFATTNSSDSRRDDVVIRFSTIEKIEREASHLRVATAHQGNWDFFADSAALTAVEEHLLNRGQIRTRD
jgi:hypothetical protein